MLSHQNITNEMLSVTNSITVYKDDLYMAHLPLAHVLELVVESWLCLVQGIPIGYSTPYTMTDRSTKIKQGHQGDVSVLRPTIMVTVPLVLDRIYKSIQEKIETGPPIKKAIFNLAVQYKLYWTQRGYNTPIINASVVFKFSMRFFV